VGEQAPFPHREGARDVRHPAFMWRHGAASNLTRATVHVDNEQQVVRDPSLWHEPLHAEAIGSAITARWRRMHEAHVVVRVLCEAGGMSWRCSMVPIV